MTCDARGCDQHSTPPAVHLLGATRRFCADHKTAALVWSILAAPDLDGRPHAARGCAIPNCTRARALGRAVCRPHAEIGDNA